MLVGLMVRRPNHITCRALSLLEPYTANPGPVFSLACRNWSSRVLREPLFSVGCSRVSSARGESYAEISFEAVQPTVGFLVQDVKIPLVA